MLIGGCGLRWDRDVYEWNKQAGRRLLGQRPASEDKVHVTDFSAGRGLYILHNAQGIYYVGLSLKFGRLSGRLADHTIDRHADHWDRFSWFSFDGPSGIKDVDGIDTVDDDWDHYGDDLTTAAAVKDLEAIMILALKPHGNDKEEKLGVAEVWEQVANIDRPPVETLEHLRDRIE